MRNNTIAKQFKTGSGCYIIRNGETVLYVGQSRKLENRWQTHQFREYIEDHFPSATVETVHCEEVDLHKNEAVLIKLMKPVLNYSHKRDYHKILGTNPYWWWLKIPLLHRKKMIIGLDYDPAVLSADPELSNLLLNDD